jgi:putative lipoic acid-binding regulatory protein
MTNSKPAGEVSDDKGSERATLLEFPCRFPVKAMGRNSDDFTAVISEIILSRAELAEGEVVRTSLSKAGNYLALTAVIEAQSKEQLDGIYQALTDCKQVVMAL